MIFFTDTEVAKKQQTVQKQEPRKTKKIPWMTIHYYFYSFFVLQRKGSGKEGMITVNKSKSIMGQFHWKRKKKKAEGKSPDIGSICSLSAKAWCLKIIAEIAGILNESSRKPGGFWTAYVKLRGKNYSVFCESHKYKEQGVS